MAVKRLSDEEWELIEPIIRKCSKKKKRKDGRGRPRVSDRECLDGIIWILITGAKWSDLPDDYPSASTCWRRLNEWSRSKVFNKILQTLLERLRDEGKLGENHTALDSQVVIAKKGALVLGGVLNYTRTVRSAM